MVSNEPLAPAVVDPHLSGLFEPVHDEVDVAGLEVLGELPPEMSGSYLRNGPNPRFSPLGRFLYPVDGDGMLHRVTVSGGRAGYRNRFVRTPALQAEESAGHAIWGGLATGVVPGPGEAPPDLVGTLRDLPNVSVVRHGGRLLALAESSTPFRIGPDLATLGRETFDGMLPAGMTAHPKIDPRTGEMAVLCYGLEAPYLTWAVLGPDGAVVRPPVALGGVDRPVMIHDMALTEHYVVAVLGPLFFDVSAVVTGGSLLSWEPEAGTRVALVPRDGSAVRWFDSPAFWTWHTANAFERADGTVVLDHVSWSYPGGLTAGHVANHGGLTRAVLDPVAGTMTRDVIADAVVEFPRIDDRGNTREHRWVATVGSTDGADLRPGDHDALRFIDTRDGTTAVWAGGDLSVGEACHVPRPGDDDPDHGWWVVVATDRTDLSSWFVVLPAADPAAGPLARVRLPVRVPLGLHGTWLPDPAEPDEPRPHPA